ncbi:MAG TPA: terminase family protein, partial [Alphaproteobacteria bacterium]|nr:terminase family protein [Alphaproteobacteria bacterium]
MLFEAIQADNKDLYRPQDKQKQFHNAILNRAENGYRDFLYGGAAKGGKSHALRWEAHRNCIHYPRLRGLLIRSSFPELERTHLSRVLWDLPSSWASYNSQKHVLRYKNESILEFGYGDKKEDFQQYLSAEYDFILIDEMTTIPFEFLVMLKMRLAASRADFIPFFAGATNPGGKSHVQVRAFYVRKEGVDEELCPEYDPKEVFFLPATVYDNEILMDRDPGIIKRLQALPEKERQKYLLGNWDIFEGQFFDEWFEEVHVVKPENYLPYDNILQMNVLGGMDYGRDTFVYWGAKDHIGNIIIFDEYWDVGSPRSKRIVEQKKFMEQRRLLKYYIKADTNMWIRDAFDVESSSMAAEEYISAGIKLEQVSKTSLDNRGYRINANDAIRDALHWEQKDGKIIKQPKLKIYQRCHKLIDCLPSLITDQKDVEDIADGQYDHPYDGFKYLYMSLRETKKQDMPAPDQW